VLYTWDEKYLMVEPIYAFDEESEAFHEAVSKVDEFFFHVPIRRKLAGSRAEGPAKA
jgi:hypothetical protein